MNSPVLTPSGSDNSVRKDGQFALTTVLSVLIVEDDAIIGMLLAKVLQKMGYDVCAVSATEDDAVAISIGLNLV